MVPASSACSLKFFQNLDLLSPNNYCAQNSTLSQGHVGSGTTFGDSWLPSWHSRARRGGDKQRLSGGGYGVGLPTVPLVPSLGKATWSKAAPLEGVGDLGQHLHPRQRVWLKTLWWWCFHNGAVGGDENGTNAANKSPQLLALTRWPEPPKAPEKNSPFQKFQKF